MYRVGLDIGGTKINIGIIDYANQSARIIATHRYEVKEVKGVFTEIKSAIEKLCAENGIDYSQLGHCGVGIPGTVSSDGRRILKVPNIDILSDDFADRLVNTLGIPVTMIQDSRAAAWGEYLCGNGKGADTLICMTLGTGIGTGIVINGKVYHGALGAAGELGHIPVEGGLRRCGCGKQGCIEKYCAGGGFDITARELLGEGKTAKDLFSAARGGNIQAKEAIDKAIVLLGTTVVAAINLLSPNAILFSGGLSKESEYLSAVIDFAKSHCYSSGELPVLDTAALGELAPMVGAALCDLSLS